MGKAKKIVKDLPVYHIAEPDLHRYGQPSKIKYPRSLTEEQCRQLKHAFKERFARERFFGDGAISHVYQRRLAPPCFMIFPSFPQVRRVLSDLNLPNDRRAIYYSAFQSAGDYLGVTGKTYTKCQRFTVELFGVRLSPAYTKKYAPQYNIFSPATFWSESSSEVIQVWRTRVYSHPPADIGISSSQPMSPYSPSFPYLESRWHPDRDKTALLLGGLGGYKYAFSELDKFYARAFSILSKTPIKEGRPKGSGLFSTRLEFWKRAVKIHNELWIKNGTKPSQGEVAWVMNKMSVNTFKDLWSHTDGYWADIPPPELTES